MTPAPEAISNPAGNIMSRVLAALSAAAILAFAAAPANAGCANCYVPQPCVTCYQQQVVPPQYRAVQETVMVAPGRVIAHRTPAQYRTVMEILDNAVMLLVPGAMEAGLASWVFWGSLAFAFAVAFV